MNQVETVTFQYYAPIPGALLLAVGVISILLAAAGIVLLIKLFNGKR